MPNQHTIEVYIFKGWKPNKPAAGSVVFKKSELLGKKLHRFKVLMRDGSLKWHCCYGLTEAQCLQSK